MVEVHEGRISVKPAPRDRAKGGGLSEPSLENRVIVGPGGTTVQRDDTHIKQVHVPPCTQRENIISIKDSGKRSPLCGVEFPQRNQETRHAFEVSVCYAISPWGTLMTVVSQLSSALVVSAQAIGG